MLNGQIWCCFRLQRQPTSVFCSVFQLGNYHHFRSNASALSFDIQIKYYSSQELKIALSKSQKIGPSAPELNLRKRIEENTFYRADGKSAERTVNIWVSCLRKRDLID